MTTAYVIGSPVAGADLNAKSSTLGDMNHKLGTVVLASDGFSYTLVLADTAHSSTANIIVNSGASFSADTAASAGVATHACRTTGGVTAGQYFWARGQHLTGAAV